jgi:two-component system OmpR family sensor kinase
MDKATPQPNFITRIWDRISLRTRLTALSVGIVALLLGVSLIGTVAVLKTYLQQNSDKQIAEVATLLASEDPISVKERIDSGKVAFPPLPGDYYIAFLDSFGRIWIGLVGSPIHQADVPNLSQFNLLAVEATLGKPFSADITQGDKENSGHPQEWRLIALPLESRSGSVVVGIPLESSHGIIVQYRSIAFGFSAALLALSGFALWLTISSALRPLREVSAAADAVRKGKFDRRLPVTQGKTEIAQLNHSLNEMLGSIEDSITSRNKTVSRMRQFVSDASHELRTPLVTLRGYAELYRKGAFKSKAQVDDAMSRIENEAIRMSTLVESLLALARLDEDVKLHLSRGDLRDLTANVVKNVSAGFNNAEIRLTDLSNKKLVEPVEANFDELAMIQVLTNLLSNACKFAGDKPIEISLGNKDGVTILKVIDHGEGIPKQLRAKVFERFYRSDNSRNRDTGGSGLGLAIAKEIIDAHHGKIVAEETKYGGATFKITLPN